MGPTVTVTQEHINKGQSRDDIQWDVPSFRTRTCPLALAIKEVVSECVGVTLFHVFSLPYRPLYVLPQKAIDFRRMADIEFDALCKPEDSQLKPFTFQLEDA